MVVITFPVRSIGGVPVRARVDLLDIHSRVIDFKSSCKNPNRIDHHA